MLESYRGPSIDVRAGLEMTVAARAWRDASSG